MRTTSLAALAAFSTLATGCLGTTSDPPDAGSASSSSGGGTSSSSGGRADAGRADAGGQVILSSVVTGRLLAPSGAFGLFEGRVWVEFEQGGRTIRRSGATRYDGKYTLGGLPAGTYTLHGERGEYSGTRQFTLVADDERLENVDVSVGAGTARFVVVDGIWDHIEDIVTGLGLQVVSVDTFDEAWLTTVANANYLSDKTAVMINCGAPDDLAGLNNLETYRQVLRTYVENGGGIYISDQAYDVAEWLFPEALDFHGEDTEPNAAEDGKGEVVLAQIGDETLSKLVGESVPITYDLSSWAVIAGLEGAPDGGYPDGGAPPAVEVLARGTVHLRNNSELVDVPLAVRIPFGQGSVVYTTFHNEAQLDETVVAILRYMVMRL